jgi:hypothetical protein
MGIWILSFARNRITIKQLFRNCICFHLQAKRITYCALELLKIPDDGQSPQTRWFWQIKSVPTSNGPR